MQQTFQNRFLPAITDAICNDTEREPLPFTTHFGRFAILFYEKAEAKCNNSSKLTAQITPLINNQNTQYAVNKT